MDLSLSLVRPYHGTDLVAEFGGPQYLFLREFTAAFGGPYYSVKCSLDTAEKHRRAWGPSRSRVTAQQLGFIRRRVAGKEFTALKPPA
jgi:hypothetical protein